MLRNSLSSSRDSTPNIAKLSRAGTPTPLLQSVSVVNKNSSNHSDYYQITSRVKEECLGDENNADVLEKTHKNTSISADETINSILNETNNNVKVKHSSRKSIDKNKSLNDLNTNGCFEIPHNNIELNVEENDSAIRLVPDFEEYSNDINNQRHKSLKREISLEQDQINIGNFLKIEN